MEAAGEGPCETDRRPERLKNDPELDLFSSEFNALKALYSTRVEVPCPYIEPSQSIEDYECDGSKSKAKKQEEEKKVDTVEKKQKILCEEYLIPVRRKQKLEINVMTRMQDPPAGHMEVLHECLQNRIRVRVVVRSFKGIRGICVGFIEAFDKFFNLVLRDVDEIYKIPSKGQRFYHEETVTVSKILEFSSEIPGVQKKTGYKYSRNSKQNDCQQNISKNFAKETMVVGEQTSFDSENEQDERSYYSDSGSTIVDQDNSSVDIQIDEDGEEEETDGDSNESEGDYEGDGDSYDTDGLENMEEELKALKEQLALEEDTEDEVEDCEDLLGLEKRLAFLQKHLLNSDDIEDTEIDEDNNEKYVETPTEVKSDTGIHEENNENHVETNTEVKSDTGIDKENNEKHVETPTEEKSDTGIDKENNEKHVETSTEEKRDTERDEESNKEHVEIPTQEKVDVGRDEKINEKHVETTSEDENPLGEKINKEKVDLELQTTKSIEIEASINQYFDQLDINSENQVPNVAVPNISDISSKQCTSAVVHEQLMLTDMTSTRAADQCGKIKLKPEDFRRRHANQLFIRGDNVVLVAVETSLLPEYYSNTNWNK